MPTILWCIKYGFVWQNSPNAFNTINGLPQMCNLYYQVNFVSNNDMCPCVGKIIVVGIVWKLHFTIVTIMPTRILHLAADWITQSKINEA